MEPLLVFVTGVAPGLGKSTLARELARRLDAPLFAEEDIRTHPAFATAMRTFDETGSIGLEALLDAASSFAATCHAEIHVLDALFPYLRSLLAWGHDDNTIAAFLVELRARIAPCRAVEIHLRGDTRAALQRAVAREDRGWLDWLVAQYGLPDSDALVAAFEVMAERSRRLLGDAPWPVHFADVRLP